MKFGFIGTGSMGSNLVQAFVQSYAMQPDHIIVSNRTRDKAERLALDCPGIHVADHNLETARKADCIFLCVKPGDFRHVLDEIQDVVRPDQYVISITSPVMIRDLEEHLEGKIAKVIPSICHAALSGNSLLIPGTRFSDEDTQWLYQLFSCISEPLYIDEAHTRAASDLASCGPAFLANILEQWTRAAVKVTGLPEETAVSLVEQMVIGTGKLLSENGFTLQSLQDRVAVPGGITREGLHLLNDAFTPCFTRLFQLTHMKFSEDLHKVQQSFQRAEKKL
ncbi:late competence protein ComER [Polycladomyces sp. WAk]|uniref:Pyrroline-5-carboxylate reductase n=1 Tax=Polycladomyces zharkentensis TaxID=2807616 RepID=A0ABS2WGE9_9BACL|nr:late competence protein ComER [Polycladomyces sp. WAk]MBN2908589.1 late competence protein ComER [Polycladomyces sp. WAk]